MSVGVGFAARRWAVLCAVVLGCVALYGRAGVSTGIQRPQRRRDRERIAVAPSGDPNLADRLLRVRAPGCDEAAELATGIMAIDTARPEPVTPQRPITVPA